MRAGFIHADLACAGDLELSDPAPTFVLDRRYELGPLALELLDGLLDVVTHEEQRVMPGPPAPSPNQGGPLSRSEARRRSASRRPHPPLQPQHVAKKPPSSPWRLSAKMMVCVAVIMAPIVVRDRPPSLGVRGAKALARRLRPWRLGPPARPFSSGTCGTTTEGGSQVRRLPHTGRRRRCWSRCWLCSLRWAGVRTPPCSCLPTASVASNSRATQSHRRRSRTGRSTQPRSGTVRC